MDDNNQTNSPPIPTVKELRSQGWRVKCFYFRIENGIQWRLSPKVIQENYSHYLREERHIHGPFRSCRGGKTIIDILHSDGRHGVGTSICSPKDCFVRKSGRELAIKRALENVVKV